MQSNRTDENGEKNNDKIDDDLVNRVIGCIGYERYFILKRDQKSAEKVLNGLIKKRVSNDVFSIVAIFYQERYHIAPVDFLERYRNEVYSEKKVEPEQDKSGQGKSDNRRTTLSSKLKNLISDICCAIYSVIK